MLASRYRYDKQAILQLNPLQLQMRQIVEDKVNNNIYRFESVPCCVCGGENFEKISEKDRYGLYFPVVICKDCGLMQTNPRMNQEAYNQFYDQEYRKLYLGQPNPTPSYFSEQYFHGGEIYNFMLKAGIISPTTRDLFVLEVGCGGGGILKYFRDKGFKVKGIDLDSQYVEKGRQEYGLDLSYGTLEELRLEQKPDIIIYNQVMEHILDPVSELKKVHQVLADNGSLFIQVPGLGCFFHPYNVSSYKLDFLRLLQNAHTYHFTLNSLNNLMQKCGFRLRYGNEIVQSVFVKGPANENYKNDYSPALKALHRLEIYRRFYPLYFAVKRLPKLAALKVIDLLGLRKVLIKRDY